MLGSKSINLFDPHLVTLSETMLFSGAVGKDRDGEFISAENNR